MHQSLSNLPNKVIVDTNVLLDAAFVSDGLARKSIIALQRLGLSLLLSEGVANEGADKLEFFAKQLELDFAPIDYWIRYLNSIALERIPSVDPVLGFGVNKSDQHVAAVARQHHAWILTGDAPLVMEAQKLGLSARFPWDVLMECALQEGRYEDIGNFIRVVPPGDRCGLIFARVLPGAWSGLKDVGRFTVCDIENVGRIYYDTQSSEWKFDLQTRNSVSLKWILASDRPTIVCGTYSFNETSSGGVLRLRASDGAQRNQANKEKIERPLTGNAPGSMSFGHTVGREDYWNGYLRSIVIGPQGVSDKTWKALTSIPEAAPNPYDADGLRRSLRLLNRLIQADEGQIAALSEHQLLTG